MVTKFLYGFIIWILSLIVVSLIGGLLLWLSWELGIRALFTSLPSMNYGIAFFCMIFVSMLGSAWRGIQEVSNED